MPKVNNGDVSVIELPMSRELHYLPLPRIRSGSSTCVGSIFDTLPYLGEDASHRRHPALRPSTC